MPEGRLSVGIVRPPLRLEVPTQQGAIDECRANHLQLYSCLSPLGLPYAMKAEDALPETIVTVDPAHFVLVVFQDLGAGYLHG